MGKPRGTTVEKRAHAKRRALERHGVNLNKADLLAIREMIDKSKAKFIERQSADRTVWLINYKDAEMVGIYSRRHGTLVTVFPPEDTEKFKARMPNKWTPPAEASTTPTETK
jgi:hypothetical protein